MVSKHPAADDRVDAAEDAVHERLHLLVPGEPVAELVVTGRDEAVYRDGHAAGQPPHPTITPAETSCDTEVMASGTSLSCSAVRRPCRREGPRRSHPVISTWARRQFPWQLFLSGSARSDRGKEGEGGQEAFRGWPVALDDDVAEVDRIGQIAVAVDHCLLY